jgi:hypothetical protein
VVAIHTRDHNDNDDDQPALSNHPSSLTLVCESTSNRAFVLPEEIIHSGQQRCRWRHHHHDFAVLGLTADGISSSSCNRVQRKYYANVVQKDSCVTIVIKRVYIKGTLKVLHVVGLRRDRDALPAHGSLGHFIHLFLKHDATASYDNESLLRV